MQESFQVENFVTQSKTND